MHTIAIKLRAERLANPDLDIRYTLPDLLAERSDGIISDDGHDYVGDTNDLAWGIGVATARQIGVEMILASNSYDPGIPSRFQFLRRVSTTSGASVFYCFVRARHMRRTMHIALYGGQRYRREARRPRSVQRTGASRFAQSEIRSSSAAGSGR